jgi:lysyl-tRNA synthetase class 2
MSIPDYREHEEFCSRLVKLAEIRALQIDPYPPQFSPSHKIHNLHNPLNIASGTSEEAAAGTTTWIKLAGRLVLFRPMGKNAFAHIQDDTGRIQLMFNRDLTKVANLDGGASITPIKFIEKKLDLGDILGIEGHLFHTHTGELTVFVKLVTLLCKALLPLPDKHSGLIDKELRYRKRWLDLIDHPDVVATFQLRSRVLRIVREFFHNRAFMEVETPVLQNLYGGAEARPFVTHLHALDQQMYLRIALEIALKKLVVGGMERIFEIGKVFRNEGIDRTHNPEFTMLEAYAAYADYEEMMTLTEQLFEKIALELFGTTNLTIHLDETQREYCIDLKAPWMRMTMKEALKTYAQLDVSSLSDDEMRTLIKEHEGVHDTRGPQLARGALIAKLFALLVEEQLIQPHHIIDHPIETTPLCKPHRNPTSRAAGLVERFETFILGYEFCNAYTELNDPELQRKLLEEQVAKREQGDAEAHPLDEEFIEVICQGMPPTGGLGIGIDRLVLLFAMARSSAVRSIKDVLFFPIMRPPE